VGETHRATAAQATISGPDLYINAKLTCSQSPLASLEWPHARYTDFPNDPSYVPSPAAGNDLIIVNGTGFQCPTRPTSLIARCSAAT
jgi:hypothetical protein